MCNLPHDLSLGCPISRDYIYSKKIWREHLIPWRRKQLNFQYDMQKKLYCFPSKASIVGPLDDMTTKAGYHYFWDHLFSTYTKFSEKQAFRTPWCAHVLLVFRNILRTHWINYPFVGRIKKSQKSNPALN